MCMVEIVLHCCSGFAFDQPSDTLCFLLHTGHHTNCGSSFAYVRYACTWSVLKGSMRKKTLCIDEHITACHTSISLFS